MEKLTVYGADWCKDTQRTLKLLETLGVTYDYINIEEDPQAAAWVREQNEGKERKPTVRLGTRVFSTPTDDELTRLILETEAREPLSKEESSSSTG